jgi:hypothetical protein
MRMTGKQPASEEGREQGKPSLYQAVTDKIIAELAQGRVPWVRPWGDATAGLGLPGNKSIITPPRPGRPRHRCRQPASCRDGGAPASSTHLRVMRTVYPQSPHAAFNSRAFCCGGALDGRKPSAAWGGADCLTGGSNLADEHRARNRRHHLAVKPDARCYRAKSALVSARQTHSGVDELVGEDRGNLDRPTGRA